MTQNDVAKQDHQVGIILVIPSQPNVYGLSLPKVNIGVPKYQKIHFCPAGKFGELDNLIRDLFRISIREFK